MTLCPLLDFPVVDGHFHLWQPGRLLYPWLSPDAPPPSFGSADAIRHEIGLEDYRLAMAPAVDIRGGVHVEAGCADPMAETAWVTSQAMPGFVLGHVVQIDMMNESAAGFVNEALTDPFVRGFRMRLNADRRINPGGVAADAARYTPAFAAMEAAGTVFDLSIFPGQAAEAARLAARWPGLTFVLNHLGWPRIETGQDSFSNWRSMIRTLAKHRNVAIKLSMLWPIDRAWRADRLRPFVLEAIESFGPERTIWGSNFPIETIFGKPGEQIAVLLEILNEVDGAALEDIFRRSACRIYGIEQGACGAAGQQRPNLDQCEEATSRYH